MISKTVATYFVVSLSIFVTIEAKSLQGKVVGGCRANIKDFAHSAFIDVIDTNVGYICGASIVNQKVLLTAAHCLDPVTKNSDIYATVGHVHNKMGTKVAVIGFKTHEKYDFYSIANDIALMALRKPLKFGMNVKRISIAKSLPSNVYAFVAGWGLINEESPKRTDLLHQVKQKVWDRKKCQSKINRIPKGTFCGGQFRDIKYPSQGDSGSALVVEGYQQIGIVSFKRLSKSRSLVVYTDVAYFYGWLKKNLVGVFCMRKRNWV